MSIYIQFPGRWMLESEIKKTTDFSIIVFTSAQYYSVEMRDILSKKRDHKTVEARHMAIYLTRNLTQLTFKNIAKRFNLGDHTVALGAVNKIKGYIDVYPSVKQDFLLLSNIILNKN